MQINFGSWLGGSGVIIPLSQKFGFITSGDVKMFWFWYSWGVEIVWFWYSLDVEMVWFFPSWGVWSDSALSWDVRGCVIIFKKDCMVWIPREKLVWFSSLVRSRLLVASLVRRNHTLTWLSPIYFSFAPIYFGRGTNLLPLTTLWKKHSNEQH